MMEDQGAVSCEVLELEEQVPQIRAQVEARLTQLIPSELESPERLHKAIRYSLLSPGKRIRPVFTVMTALHLGGQGVAVIDVACAFEMLHCASLILDDLPSMDNAVLRRGQPANHCAFGEATAMLAALALLNRAYGVISEVRDLPASVRLEMITSLSNALGSEGVIAGQVYDLHPDWQVNNVQSVEFMHGQKTGALFVASAEAGARVAGLKGTQLDPIRAYAWNFGVAFQILDDLLDASSTDVVAGKETGKDVFKATFVSLEGTETARIHVSRFVDAAVAALVPLGPQAVPLAQFARSLLNSHQGVHYGSNALV
jgi:geranylgeranyl diphosphate synthase type II